MTERKIDIKGNHAQKCSPDSLDVSVIVCTKNAADTIVQCLRSIKENNPKEIILVDANSDAYVFG